MKIIIREARIEDRDNICSLLSYNSAYKRDREFWIWINKVIYNSESITSIAEHNNKIVGHYAILPNRIVNGNKRFSSGIGIHAFIHPDYRGKVFMYKISELAYEQAKKEGIQIVYGFPNINYRQIQLKIEGWEEISTFSSKDFDLKEIKYNLHKNIRLEPFINTFENQFKLDRLITWKMEYGNFKFYKNLNFYINRYVNHPQKLYQCYFIYKNQLLEGFIVFKIFEVNRGHIIDFVKSSNLTIEELIDISIDYFKDKVNILSLWPVNYELNKYLNYIGNFTSGFETFFGIKVLDKNVPFDEIKNFSKWELMMGDSDAF